MRHGLIFTTIVAVHGFIQIPTIGGHVAVQPATAKLNPIASNFGEAAFPATAPPLPPAPSQLTLLMREFTSTNKKELISLLFIALFATISATSVPLFFSRVLAALTAQNFSYKALLRPLSMMMLCHTIEPLMTIQYVKQSSSLVDKLVTALRTKTYLSILQSNVASLEAQGTTRSDVTQLVTAEMDRMKVTIMQNISRDRGIRAALELVMGLSILYSLCLPLALMFSTIIPITAFISSRFAIKMFDATRKEQAALLGLSARATETIQNLKEVYAFSNAPLELQRYNAIQLTTSKAALSTGTAKANFEASNRAGIYANIITMFGLGGIMVQKKFIAPTALVSFIGYCWSLNFATQGLLFSYGDFNVFSASYKRIAEFLGSASSDSSTFNSNPSMNGNVETSTDSKTSTAAQSTASSPMKIEFTGASFSYPTRPDVAVIRDVNLTMMPGSVTALVGPSGSGKSTLANLLCRLYEAKSGTVMIDGKDIVDIPVQSYLSRVSIVRQQPTLFTDSVFNNIAYGAVAYRNITMVRAICIASMTFLLLFLVLSIFTYFVHFLG